QEPDHASYQEIERESRAKFLGPLIEGFGQNPRHPKTNHGSGKFKRQIDFVVRMRITEIASFLRPCLDEEPEQPDVHKDSRKPQRVIKFGRPILTCRRKAYRTSVPEGPVYLQIHKGKKYAHDRRTHQEIVPVRVFDAVEKITAR